MQNIHNNKIEQNSGTNKIIRYEIATNMRYLIWSSNKKITKPNITAYAISDRTTLSLDKNGNILQIIKKSAKTPYCHGFPLNVRQR